jgi:hypothetical protein
MRATSADTIRNLVDTIPEQRLRALVVEIAVSALRCLMTDVQKPETAASVSADKARRHWSQARRAAHNAKRREKRQLAKAATGGRKPKSAGTDVSGADNRAGISAAALWKHAAKLEPKAPWRAVARELGVNDGVAQTAHRNGTLPANVSPVAAGRFLAL